MGFREQIDGNEISWQDENVSSYTTNFGCLQVDVKTEEFVECCVGFGRNQCNTRMSIAIFDGEFQITQERGNTPIATLCSKGYPYPYDCKGNISPLEVIEMLQKDNNYSIAAIIAKKELIRLMKAKLNLNKVEISAIKKLFQIWRQPIVTSVSRQPITTTIKRQPIRRK